VCTFGQVIFLHDQQAQVLAVVEGAADVAFVRADQPTILAAEGVISLDDVKILSPVRMPFTLLHTPLIVPCLHADSDMLPHILHALHCHTAAAGDLLNCSLH